MKYCKNCVEYLHELTLQGNRKCKGTGKGGFLENKCSKCSGTGQYQTCGGEGWVYE